MEIPLEPTKGAGDHHFVKLKGLAVHGLYLGLAIRPGRFAMDF